MKKRANATNITHGLAQLGGGSKKEGGEGMIGGLNSIFKAGVNYEKQRMLGNEIQPLFLIEEENDE
jgi:hypothetical protein